MDLARVRPISGNVLLRPDPPRAVTAGGIVLPKSARPLPQKATVLAVGPGELLDDGGRLPPRVRPGDRVVFWLHVGSWFSAGGVPLAVLRGSDVLAIVHGEAA